MGKWVGTSLFILLLLFLAYVLFQPTPRDRINSACLPVEGGGKVVTAVASAVKAGWEAPTRNGMDKATHFCRFTVFKVFYADELARQKAAAEAANNEGK